MMHTHTPAAEHTAVAMSGGVDSSVAALLARRAGGRVTGLTMQLPFCTDDAAHDARRVAEQLGIAHTVTDVRREFCALVVDPFAADYEAGRTPNPCVMCNRTMKFGVLLDRARALGCTALATGHYAQVAYDEGCGRYLLRRAVHPDKDQSYFLALLDQAQLRAARFPLGALRKDEIRTIAHDAGLVTAQRTDSQDICFVPDGGHADFLRRYTGRDYPHGPFLDEGGRTVGTHHGIVAYTRGQRRGLGVSSSDGRRYVTELRAAENAVVLGPDAALYSKALTARGLNLIACETLSAPVRVQARIRSRHAAQPATAEQTGTDTLRVTFDTPQRAIAPGQAVVLYDGDCVIGGAVIDGIA